MLAEVQGSVTSFATRGDPSKSDVQPVRAAFDSTEKFAALHFLIIEQMCAMVKASLQLLSNDDYNKAGSHSQRTGKPVESLIRVIRGQNDGAFSL